MVVPCYNEEGNVFPFYEDCLSSLGDIFGEYEIVFVNDGSRDGTWRELCRIRDEGKIPVKLINFSRNFGKEAAMYAGLEKAEGEYVTIIDADLQQSPETVREMVSFLEENADYDAVAAYQDVRREGAFISFCKKLFYKIINKTCDIDFKSGAGDFRTFRRCVVDSILSVTEYHRFSKGIFSWVGFNTYYIPYVACERKEGKSSWSFMKLLKYAIEGMVSFSTFPLKIATAVGSLSAAAALIYMVVVVVQKFLFGNDVPGYPTIVSLILLIGGVQLITLGILGEYISRIYVQSKRRPLYVIKEYKDKK